MLADETTDSEHREQLCVCLRFVCQIDGKHCIPEEFIQFQAATNLTGEGLAESIVTILEGTNFNLRNMAQTRIREKAPLAIYVHCASHVLNRVYGEQCV